MKKLEATFCVLAMMGSMAIANQLFFGWYLFLISSVMGAYWSIKTKNYWVAGMQCFFTVTNLIGVFNYCF